MIPNWDEVRKEYIIGKVSVAKLSQKYGVSRASIYNHITAESWEKHKKEHTEKKAEAICQAIRNKDIQVESKHACQAMKYAEKACDNLLKALAEQSEDVKKMPPTQASAWAKALETAIKIARDVHNIPSLFDEERMAIAKRDLAMREEEHKKNMETGTTEPIVIKFENDIQEYAK